MKPVKLTMEAFGPFPGSQSVDFSQLDSGIYLITGETGAGKTTIFDAISYALYGKASGDERADNMLRSDFATQDMETAVELEFLYAGESYRIRRRPQQSLPKKRGNGQTTRPAEAVLYMPDGDVVEGINQVNERVATIMGLDRSQFAQTMMLAQGDFSKLLLCDTKERINILRDIFSTAGIKRFQEKLAEECKQARDKLRSLEDSFFQYAGDIMAGSPKTSEKLGEWLAGRDIYTADVLFGLLENIREADGLRLDGLEASRAEHRQKAQQLAIALDNATAANGQLDELDEAVAGMNKLLEQQADMDSTSQKLSVGLKALRNVYPHDEKLENARKGLHDLKAGIAAQESILNQTKHVLDEAEKGRGQALLKQPRINKLRTDISLLEQQMGVYTEMDALRETISTSQSEKLQAEELSIEAKNALVQLNEQREKTKIILDEMPVLQSNFDKLSIEFEKIESIRKTISEAINIYDTLKNDKAELEDMRKRYIIYSRNYDESRIDYDRLSSAFLDAQAGIMAEALEDGIPCPVCGSLEHPSPGHKPEGAPTQEQVRLAEERSNELNAERERLSALCNSMEGAVSSLTKQLEKLLDDLLGDGPRESVGDELKALERETSTDSEHLRLGLELLKNRLADKPNHQSKLNGIDSEIARAVARAEDGQKQLERLGIRIAEDSSRLEALARNAAYGSHGEAEKAMSAARHELDGINKEVEEAESAYRQASTAYDSSKGALEERNGRLPGMEESVALAEENLKRALLDSGFADIEQYKMALITQQQANEMQSSLDEYNSSLLRARERVSVLECATAGKDRQDSGRLQAQKQQADEALEEAIAAFNECNSRQMSNNAVMHKLRKAEGDIAEARSLYSCYSGLSDTANGNLKSKDRITFEAYVQAMYFGRILHAANRRLQAMTGGRYSLERRQQADNKKQQAGLDLDVLDNYTGKLRNVRTLSGGETFKASLALALGLSDTVQESAGRVRLDAMFIDEGFGSLDSESLVSAINTLQGMAGAGRSIGIISHVAELASMIDKQIRVSRGRLGSSVEVDC